MYHRAIGMVHVMLHTNRSFTDEFFPLFEIVYGIEIVFILIFYLLTPGTCYMLWNARPFHRNVCKGLLEFVNRITVSSYYTFSQPVERQESAQNEETVLRLSLCNLLVQGFLGTSARLIFMFNQYVDSGPLEERSSVILASLLRAAMLEAFVGAIFFISIERFLATFAWSWYEKESKHTLVAFIVLEGCATLWSWTWAIGLTFEYVTVKIMAMGIACSAGVGISVGLFVVAANYRTHLIMKAGATINRYSVARTFQIRENIAILTALFKIAVNVMVLNVPLFVLGVCQVFLPDLKQRMITRAIFDLIISIYPFMIISYIPLSDVTFERSLKRMRGGHRLFHVFRCLRCVSEKISPKRTLVNAADHYFSVLAQSLYGPPMQ